MEKKSNRSTGKPKRKRVSRPKSRGLGDTIEKVTEATGIKKAVEVVSDALGVDCGCEKRKEWLNERFSYKNVECMTAEQASRYQGGIVVRNELTPKQQKYVAEFHAELFKHPIEHPCKCTPSIWRGMVEDIDELYAAYQADQEQA